MQTGKQKTLKKSVYWARHGTHSLDPGQLAKMQREKLHRPKPEMYASVKEAFDAARKSK